MTQVTIYADNTICVAGTNTGYYVEQTSTGTRVRAYLNNGYPLPRDLGVEVSMPIYHYALSVQGGRDAFCRDFLAIWNAHTRGE